MIEEDYSILSDIELIDRCDSWIESMIRAGVRDWKRNTSTCQNEDPDLLFSELIERFKKKIDKNEKLEDELSKSLPKMLLYYSSKKIAEEENEGLKETIVRQALEITIRNSE